MKKELRGEKRFKEIGRIDCERICALPGVLDNISCSGLSCHFPNPVLIDNENEYTVFITFSRPDFSRVLELVCAPQWIKENEDETVIGFKILRSPDSPVLTLLIENLNAKSAQGCDISDMIISSEAEFIG